MRRVELIEDIFITIVIVFVFGTVFSVTLAFKDTQEPTVAYVSTPIQADVTQKTRRVPQATVLGARHKDVGVTSKTTPEEGATEPEKEEAEVEEEEVVEEIIPTKSSADAPAVVPQTTPVKQNVTTPSDGNQAYIQELTSLIHAQTNAFRKKNGLHTLASDSALAQQAQSHSTQMLREDFFSHTNSDGCNFTCRFKASGYDAQTWGENLGQYSFSDFPSAESVASYFMKGWQKSSGHRENLLGETFTNQGVGIAMDNGTIYVTVDFAQPMPR